MSHFQDSVSALGLSTDDIDFLESVFEKKTVNEIKLRIKAGFAIKNKDNSVPAIIKEMTASKLYLQERYGKNEAHDTATKQATAAAAASEMAELWGEKKKKTSNEKPVKTAVNNALPERAPPDNAPPNPISTPHDKSQKSKGKSAINQLKGMITSDLPF